jgi:hypothetical protein
MVHCDAFSITSSHSMEMTMSKQSKAFDTFISDKQIDMACDILKTLAKAKGIRNPVVGKAHERLYRIDAATMRRIRKLVG